MLDNNVTVDVTGELRTEENDMNREFTITAPKTYATADNARKAVAKKGFEGLRHFIMTNEEGRFFPVFVGQAAMQDGVHFHFNVVG